MVNKRSPNYPSVSLEEAIQALTELYQGVGRGKFTASDAARAWGYTSTSGPTKRRMSSLRQYGLIEGKKGDTPVVSTRALTLVLRNQASREYQQALREAATSPPLFSELVESMASAAPDALKQNLVVERNFTDEGAGRFINVFKATIALANLSESDNMARQEEDHWDGLNEDEEEEPVTPPPPPAAQPGTMTIPIPLGGDRIGNVVVPIDMSATEWIRFDRVLGGYRPDEDANVRERPTPEPEESNS